MRKKCKCCGEIKDESEFYKNQGVSDGYSNTCKECTKKRARENRAKRIEYYREYDRSRSNNPERVEARAEYRNTENYRISHDKAAKKYIERKKRSCHIAVGNAIRDGKLIKQPCEVCGKDEVVAHHPNYDKPLDVMWLCPEHHAEWHKENGEGENPE